MSSLTAVQFPVDAQTGYVTGVGTQVILKTTDGGSTWVTTFIPTNDVYSIEFPLDAQTGYVGGRNGNIYKTTNGGASWTLTVVGPGFVYSLHFPVDAQTGYAGWTKSGSTPEGRIYKTTDGGTTWAVVLTEDASLFNSVFFIDSRTGFAAAHDFSIARSTAAGSIIFKTTNSGQTWSRHDLGSSGGLLSVTFTDAQTGYAVGNHGVIVKTTDQGATWAYRSSSPTQYFVYGATIYSVNFPVDAQTGYAVGGYPDKEGVILKTTSGGAAWVPQYFDTTDGSIGFRSVHFPQDAQTGYAVGKSSDGRILKTTNGGIAWTVVGGDDSSANFNAVHFVNNQSGYVVGGDPFWGRNIIQKTTDGGASWTRLTTGISTINLLSVHFPVDMQTGYAVGDSGPTTFILKTTNGGTTWVRQYSMGGGGLGSYQFDDVQFPLDAQTGFVVGCGMVSPNAGSQIVLKTTNGGALWVASFPPGGVEFYSVDFPVGVQTGYAVGEGETGWSTICKTTDGGATWVRQNSATRQNFYGVDFPPGNALTGYAVGGNWGSSAGMGSCMIRKTTTGGSSGIEDEETGVLNSRPNVFWRVLPNPFTSFARVPGHEAERFALFDVTGRKVGIFKGERIGEGLRAGVYFLRPEDRNARPLRIVKVR
jgi:photosystem II stability/assembly factor-like uncharacterized protein